MQDVRTIGANQTTLLVPAYMGYVHALLNNPHHKQELSDMVRRSFVSAACADDAVES